MIEQFQHKLTTSFFLWFDNFLLEKGEAYTNSTGEFFYYDDPRLDATYKAYGSPYKQWVTDSSITDAIIPTGVFINDSFSGRDDGVVLDFDNGRVLVSGSATDSSITGEFAVKDFSVYLTNDTEDDLNGVMSIFMDSVNEVITSIPMSGYPITELGDLKGNNFNYTGVEADYEGETKFFVDKVKCSKLSDRTKNVLANELYVGFIDFDIQQHRYRFS
jgi:hypothetical protein